MKKLNLLIIILSILVVIAASGAALILWKLRDTNEQIAQTNNAIQNFIVNNTVQNNTVTNVVNNTTNTPVNATNNTTNTPANSVPTNTTPNPTPTPTVWTEISHGDTSKKQVIFTFDAGSGNQSAQKILDVLAKHHVKGTFFITGKFAEANPAYVKKFSEAGHEIFNHTYDHPDLTKSNDQKVIDELNHADSVISALTGKTTKPYFRPPYGARNQHVRDLAKSLGYRSVFWSVDALDWKESSGETADQVASKILSNIKPGNIFLMHIGDTITGNILDDVFTQIEGKGFAIVSLTQGL